MRRLGIERRAVGGILVEFLKSACSRSGMRCNRCHRVTLTFSLSLQAANESTASTSAFGFAAKDSDEAGRVRTSWPVYCGMV